MESKNPPHYQNKSIETCDAIMSQQTHEENIGYLSKIKYDVLKYISTFIKQHRYSPTYKEIAVKFKFSRARAGAIVAELFKLNLISKGGSAHRKIRLTDTQTDSIPTLLYNKEYSAMDLR